MAVYAIRRVPPNARQIGPRKAFNGGMVIVFLFVITTTRLKL
jgi:hypothetical protein